MDILAKNLLILASAGSGKTYQLGNRVISLVARGAAPEKIVALTFTRKAAGEFADSVLTKLAKAAEDPAAAARLRDEILCPGADFQLALETVVRALPRFTLGTMDSFFARVVKAFQYELGLVGGRFDLIEGPRAAAATDGLLAAALGDALGDGQDEEFYHAFRRATLGREDHGVLDSLRDFVAIWQEILRSQPDAEWGPASLAPVNPDEWAKQKSAFAARVRSGIDDIAFTRKGQREALEKSIEQLENHVIGGGSLGSSASTLTKNILQAVATQTGTLRVKSHTEFEITGISGEAIRAWVKLAAQCELAAALSRTRAVRQVVSLFDQLCETRLRTKGMLGFSDVKFLMGEWAHGEEARLRREAVDFRLDASIDHWLLDEFQDTSRSDWSGLQPLIDEAAAGEDGSLFVVGDRKQAIYAWRGGDVGLFDELIGNYGSELKIEPMDESFRSCPEVLSLVNRVCGDHGTLKELFGPVHERWAWHEHRPAPALCEPEKRGESRVEIVGDWDERMDRLVGILEELEVGGRDMTCGVLLRSNDKARKVSQHLRLHGFDVIEEGCREPSSDNPVGIVVFHLLRWLADPADRFAWELVGMSPLAVPLAAVHGDSMMTAWNSLTRLISMEGFARALGSLVDVCWEGWSEFGRRRAGDLFAALAAMDARGVVSPAEAADWLGRLEVSQSPGAAAVQVMTIHKSKGLGFDVVVLPDVPDDPIPQTQYFDVASGPGWLSQTPAKWARDLSPEMCAAEERWACGQRYEAFCTLYVALTRSKRGLYVLLEPPSKTADPDKPSLANWIARSIESTGEPGIVWRDGSSAWFELMPVARESQQAGASSSQSLGQAVPRRARLTPSAAKAASAAAVPSAGGMAFGTLVHELLEQVEWIDAGVPAFPDTMVGRAVDAMLCAQELRSLFHLGGRNIGLFREQAIDAILDDHMLSGVIDRLHLHKDPSGSVRKVEIIDFKTDAVTDPGDLAKRYSGQMNAYRRAVTGIHPDAEIECLLVSVRHGVCVPVAPE